jgi:hypothetical protein
VIGIGISKLWVYVVGKERGPINEFALNVKRVKEALLEPSM